MTNEGLRIRLPFVIDDTVQAIIEQIARPYRWAKEVSTMKRTMKLMKELVPLAEQAQSIAKRKTVRAFLCCKFGTGDKSFVSVPLVAKSSGRYTRGFIDGGMGDLHHGELSTVSFYSVQIETFYICEGDNPLLVEAIHENMLPNADHVPLPDSENGDHHDGHAKEVVVSPHAAETPTHESSFMDKFISVDSNTGSVHMELKLPESGRKFMKGFGFGK